MQRLFHIACGLAASACLCATVASAAPAAQVTDAALVQRLPGFRNGAATVNGIHLHYVIGGQGSPVVLLPGWPETWWEWHKVMPQLAAHHTVIAVDLRGMGTSDKPQEGYDKKTLASKSLDHRVVKVAGSGHFIPEEQPAELLKYLDDFLN
jgi:pimeloyl-ACP methyl ester carboxylesterase